MRILNILQEGGVDSPGFFGRPPARFTAVCLYHLV
jgi:hypothetical protein